MQIKEVFCIICLRFVIIYRMRYSAYNKGLEHTIAAVDTVVYPDATIRQFLNMKRTTKDKCCLIIFLLYCLALIIMLGIGFFYGNYNAFGIFINGAATLDNRQQCSKFVSQDYLTCQSTCASGQAFLGKLCLVTSARTYNPDFSTTLDQQIGIYNLKYTLPVISYTTAALLFVTLILFLLIVYFPKITYFYIASLFLMLLSMSFFILKNVQVRVTNLQLETSSLFYIEQQKMRYISFLLLAIYLIIFPFILFSPQKIQQAVTIMGGLKKYFTSMKTMNLFTLFIIILAWGSLILEIFLLINFYSAGTISEDSNDSMFYTFTGVNLSHPASLTFHFIGVYWLFATLISWHKYFTSSAMCLWYFQESQSLYPVKRGLKRSLHHLGTAAVDAILIPVSWLLLLVYSMVKINDSGEQQSNKKDKKQHEERGCFYGFREFITNRYSSINRNSSSSALLTNLGFFQSCKISTEVFSKNRHRFFNIGGTLTIFLTLFICMLWVIITFFIIYSTVYIKDFPSNISSMILPIFAIFLIGLVIGSLFANLFTTAIDCLLFCYLMQRKNLAQGEQIQRPQNDLEIKTILDECYYRSEDEINGDIIYVYEEVNENTLDLTYITRKQVIQ